MINSWDDRTVVPPNFPTVRLSAQDTHSQAKPLKSISAHTNVGKHGK